VLNYEYIRSVQGTSYRHTV